MDDLRSWCSTYSLQTREAATPHGRARHDLRFVVDGDVAQIDHMVINRSFGISSPIEQSQRHARILQRMLESLGIGNRIGGEMSFFHVVLLHPKSIIKRPAPKAFNTTNVIKVDPFTSWHKQFVDKEATFAEALKLMVNLWALDTI